MPPSNERAHRLLVVHHLSPGIETTAKIQACRRRGCRSTRVLAGHPRQHHPRPPSNTHPGRQCLVGGQGLCDYPCLQWRDDTERSKGIAATTRRFQYIWLLLKTRNLRCAWPSPPTIAVGTTSIVVIVVVCLPPPPEAYRTQQTPGSFLPAAAVGSFAEQDLVAPIHDFYCTHDMRPPTY
jgi:hypothetical protein